SGYRRPRADVAGRSAAERHGAEADDAGVVDVPLLVVQELAARAGGDALGGVERRRAAPLELVVAALGRRAVLDQGPEAGRVAGLEAGDALAVARLDLDELALAGARRELIAVAPPDVRHVDAQHEEQILGPARGQLAQRAQEARDAVVRLGRAPVHGAVDERATQDGQDAHVRTV